MNESHLEVKYIELSRLNAIQYAETEYLYIGNNKSIFISSYSDYSKDIESINEEIGIVYYLKDLKKFKKLKEIYFLNLIFSEIPNAVASMKNIEVLQIDLYKHVNIEACIQKIKKLKKLRELIINTFFLSEEKVEKLKKALPNVKVYSLLDR